MNPNDSNDSNSTDTPTVICANAAPEGDSDAYDPTICQRCGAVDPDGYPRRREPLHDGRDPGEVFAETELRDLQPADVGWRECDDCHQRRVLYGGPPLSDASPRGDRR